MRRFVRAFFCLILCALLPLAALAEDCFVIEVDSLDMNRLEDSDYITAHLSAQTEGVRVLKYISDSNELAARVRLTVAEAETDTVVFDKNYGFVSGTFDSGNLYLPYVDNHVIPYLITLTVEDWTYSMPFMRLQPRLTDNTACTYGVRLSDYNPALQSGWIMGTMLDLNALRLSGTCTVALCASNLYLIGDAVLSLTEDCLTVSLQFDSGANVTLQSASVYLLGTVSAIQGTQPASLGASAYAVGQAIDTAGLSTALLYLPMKVSYDPSSLPSFIYNRSDASLAAQLALWEQNLQASF